MFVTYDENGKILGCFFERQNFEQLHTDLILDDLEKFKVIDLEVKDISDTREYKLKIDEQEKEELKKVLQLKIDELDKKRIRALAEGGNYNDSKTYLEYYTEDILKLRAKISEL